MQCAGQAGAWRLLLGAGPAPGHGGSSVCRGSTAETKGMLGKRVSLHCAEC